MPRSRLLLVAVIAANLIVGASLYVHSTSIEPPMRSAPLPSLGEEIQLLAELPEVPSKPPPPLRELPAAPPPPVRECRIWGPDEDPASFDELRERLLATGGVPELRESRVNAAPVHLVVVKDLQSMDAALRATATLNGLGIETYVINRIGGPVISVGLFSRSSGAASQQARITELGFAVDIEVLARDKIVYELTGYVEVESDDYNTSTRACAEIAQSK